MNDYLEMFERAIAKQAELIGLEKAVSVAKKSGLKVDSNGQVVGCEESPVVVLLRLIRTFTAEGDLLALAQCTELIDKVTEIAESYDTAVN